VEQNLATTSPNIAGTYRWLVLGNRHRAAMPLASFLVGSAPHPGPQSKFFVLLPLRNNKAVKGNKDKRSN
jgi:hypothetical protein